MKKVTKLKFIINNGYIISCSKHMKSNKMVFKYFVLFFSLNFFN